MHVRQWTKVPVGLIEVAGLIDMTADGIETRRPFEQHPVATVL